MGDRDSRGRVIDVGLRLQVLPGPEGSCFYSVCLESLPLQPTPPRPLECFKLGSGFFQMSSLQIMWLLCGSGTDGGSGGSQGASQQPSTVSGMVVAWTRLAVMEMERKEHRCVTEIEWAGFTEGQDVGRG